MMKILYDHQTFTHQDYGGISRYFLELFKELKKLENIQVNSSLLFSNNYYLQKENAFNSLTFFNSRKFKGQRSIMLYINQLISLYQCRTAQYDIFHPTYYDTYYLSLRIKKPIVITCLDLIHEKFIKNDLETLDNKRRTLLRADIILAISHSTKNDLVEYYQIPEERIFVTHLASSIRNTEPALNNSEEQYLLYVGNRQLYKNFSFFVKAITPLLVKRKDLYLYCAGGGSFTEEELILFKDLKIDSSVKHHTASDESLSKLYSTALAFFFPSLYEGFGIPIIEAMSCGCPVAASNVSSLPEVGGDAAIYFDPGNTDSILSVAEKLVESNVMRSELRDKGFKRSVDFSWKKTADSSLEAYRMCL